MDELQMAEYIDRKEAVSAACAGADAWDGGCNASRYKYLAEYIGRVSAADVAPVRHSVIVDRRKAEEYIKRKDALDSQNKSMNLAEMRVRLERLPAADVAPVKHGKWEEVDVRDYPNSSLMVASMRCDQCKLYHNEVYYYGNPTEAVCFCPRCGAKMDGEAE